MPDRIDCDKGTIVHQLLEVEAQVTVTPFVKHGKPSILCIASDIKTDCAENRKRRAFCQRRESDRSWGKCTFTVTQVICVEIPIKVGVEVDVDKGVVACGIPDIGPCAIVPGKPPCKPPRRFLGRLRNKELDSPEDI